MGPKSALERLDGGGFRLRQSARSHGSKQAVVDFCAVEEEEAQGMSSCEHGAHTSVLDERQHIERFKRRDEIGNGGNAPELCHRFAVISLRLE